MEILNRFHRAVFTAIFATLSAAGQFAASAQGVGEADLKAAFLLNFARYIQFPAEAFASADAPLSIGVIGDPQVAVALTQLAGGEHAGSRAITVQRLGTAAGAKGCQMVFIGGGDSGQLDALAGRTGCLTVGDADDFLRRGGAIRFFSGADRKVRFEINPKAIERQKLKPSGSILRLARVATDGR